MTRTIRRVARFDPEIVRLALAHNMPTRVVLNHADHVDATASQGPHTPRSLAFIRAIETAIGVPISHAGLGPGHLAPVPVQSASAVMARL